MTGPPRTIDRVVTCVGPLVAYVMYAPGGPSFVPRARRPWTAL